MIRSACLSFAFAAAVSACSPPVNNTDTGPSDAANDSSASGPAGTAFCRSLTNPTSCGNPAIPVCGACVAPPADPVAFRLTRTSCSALQDRQEYCDMATPAAAPNLTCYTGFDPMHPPTPPAPQTVTVWGVVDVFGTGGNSDGVNVQIFEVLPDGTPGAMVGQATSGMGIGAMYTEMAIERDPSGMISQMRTLAGFVIPNVQTDHPYIVRTQGVTPDFFGHALYDYTIPIRATDVDVRMPPAALMITGHSVYMRPRTISNSDWATIPSTANLPTGIPMGHGAIAGEVHDCDDVRLSNAQVYANPPPNFASVVYFSDNPTRPLPDTTRQAQGTGLLGLYAMFDLNPGAVRVTAIGYASDGTLTVAGSFGARIFPDAVTIVTFRGLRPWQYTTP